MRKIPKWTDLQQKPDDSAWAFHQTIRNNWTTVAQPPRQKIPRQTAVNHPTIPWRHATIVTTQQNLLDQWTGAELQIFQSSAEKLPKVSGWATIAGAQTAPSTDPIPYERTPRNVTCMSCSSEGYQRRDYVDLLPPTWSSTKIQKCWWLVWEFGWTEQSREESPTSGMCTLLQVTWQEFIWMILAERTTGQLEAECISSANRAEGSFPDCIGFPCNPFSTKKMKMIAKTKMFEEKTNTDSFIFANNLTWWYDVTTFELV